MVLATCVGARISQDPLEYVSSVHQGAGLFMPAIKQFRRALKRYKHGKPYELESIGLYATLDERMISGPGP